FGGAAIQRHDGGGVDRCTSAQRDGVVEDLDPADSTAPRGEEKKPADWRAARVQGCAERGSAREWGHKKARRPRRGLPALRLALAEPARHYRMSWGRIGKLQNGRMGPVSGRGTALVISTRLTQSGHLSG